MTNDQSHPEHAQDPREPMNIAALLRAAADCELGDCQCSELDSYLVDHPEEGASQIGFEKALRQSCGRVMGRSCCPDALREKVTAIAAAQEGVVGGPYTRSRSFWSRTPVLGAAAALLVLTAGALIFQSTSLPPSATPIGLNTEQVNYYNRVSNFVVREHTRCCDDKAAEAMVIEHDIDRARDYFSEEIGRHIVIPDLGLADGEVEFFGGGDCAVPLTPRSGHLRFDVVTPDGQRVSLSLFVSPDPGILPLKEGMTYRINSEACMSADTRLFAWVRDGVQYLLVSNADDELCAKVRGLMQAPPMLGSL